MFVYEMRCDCHRLDRRGPRGRASRYTHCNNSRACLVGSLWSRNLREEAIAEYETPPALPLPLLPLLLVAAVGAAALPLARAGSRPRAEVRE